MSDDEKRGKGDAAFFRCSGNHAEKSRVPFFAYLQLLRLPNVFTAVADILMGIFITHSALPMKAWPLLPFALLILTSCSLYLAGMVLNDVFDVEQDRRERPLRPIPSGRVDLPVARKLGLSLVMTGLELGAILWWVTGTFRPAVVAGALALFVLLYDASLKKTPLGPVAMGSCRFLNVLLGMSLANEAGALRPWVASEWIVATGIGVYIAGVTWFARTEARESSRRQLAAALIVLVAGLGLLASLPEWRDLTISTTRWYVLWALLAVFVAQPCIAAIRKPTPPNVQLAVKRCLLSLILLDAAVTYGARGPLPAATILLLVVPQWLLGRYVYST